MSDFIELEESSDAIDLEDGAGAILLEEDAGDLSNDLTGNPLVIKTATDSRITGPLFINGIQWADYDSGMADDDDLVFVLDGSTVTAKAQLNLINPSNNVAYEFNGCFKVSSRFEVTTIDSGQLLVWLR
jgi:hypothetical protein